MESESSERVYADLVAGLLGARTDPATQRFDAELDAAVEAGQVPAEVAHHLRFWQQSSLRVLTDHIRTVLPVALGALEAARRQAEANLDVPVAEREAGEETSAPSEKDEPAGFPHEPPPEQQTVVLPPPINLDGQRARLIVAGLVTTATADIHDENHRT